ncbi:MAG: Gfo/Idh/MocA family oxidoreductase [Ktedonobacteraceae bacterium]|nr:Gfo/Idh/MocA family oxidoreductase [Ktedonobacteraceae bacterium]MBO0792542.1 Gfo/Idh/MocA family oxidoreductase [Ktedonobacteraceae bacterium]
MPETDHHLRVALIGYGAAGSVFHAPLIASTAGMQLVAVVTGHPERQEQARNRYPGASIVARAEELWRDPGRYDLVVVATPNQFHVPLGLAALDAGLPVLIDKPLAATVADAERLLEASRRSGKLLSVFQNRRWDGDFLTVRKIVEAGLLGSIVAFESRFDRYRPSPKPGAWREHADPAEAGGLLYDIGSHLIDQAVQLFGRPLRVYAEMGIRRPAVQVDDDTFVALEFEQGVSARLWMSVVARIAGQRMRVSGLHGTYEKWGLDPQEDALRAGALPGSTGWGQEPSTRWGRLSTEVGGLHFDGQVETLPGAYEQFYAQLRDALLAGAPPPVNPSSVITVLRVIEAAQRSAHEKSTVEL